MQPTSEQLNILKRQKRFELDFAIANWPADPFGGVWIDEDMAPPNIVSICFQAQAAIAKNPEQFAIEHRRCALRSRRVSIRVSAIWWEAYLAVAAG